MPPRIMIAGFGSIGRRHLRNFRELEVEEVIVYRTGKSTLPTDELKGAQVEFDLDAALSHKPDAVVIANPTAYHLPVALAAAKAGCHLLLEKPISHTLEGVEELRQIVTEKQLTVLVGFHYRFNPGLNRVRRILSEGGIGEIVNAHVHWGEYMPGWHPWEDYRDSYAARPELGGGVLLTLCHPFDYLRWLVGEITAVASFKGFHGGLDIPVEDSADTLLQFQNGATGHVHLDYVQRPGTHTLKIVGRTGKLGWSNEDGTVRHYRVETETWESYPPPVGFERNEMYLDQTQHFLDCLEGKVRPGCTLDDGIRALEIVLGAHQASDQQKVVKL